MRIWEGSDFDIEKHLTEQIQKLKASIADLFNVYYPLNNIVVHRHSYQTGTLRYFEQRFLDNNRDSYDMNEKDNKHIIYCLA